MTPEAEDLLAFDIDDLLRKAAQRPRLLPDVLAAVRRRNRARAFLFLQEAGRRGVTSEDPKSEALLAAFRRDALRDAGVDERLVRMGGAA